jgi:hypothetical protein
MDHKINWPNNKIQSILPPMPFSFCPCKSQTHENGRLNFSSLCTQFLLSLYGKTMKKRKTKKIKERTTDPLKVKNGINIYEWEECKLIFCGKQHTSDLVAPPIMKTKIRLPSLLKSLPIQYILVRKQLKNKLIKVGSSTWEYKGHKWLN